MQSIKDLIQTNKAVLGIELGSTRIKAVLIDNKNNPIASGTFEWENKMQNGVWTYSMEQAWQGVQTAYKNLNDDVNQKYGVYIKSLAAIGISGMMHGYLAFDKNNNQLAEFRTWRNTITEHAAFELSELLNFNIPQRWSIAHLYQAILNGEEHVQHIDFITTLSGYIHWKLSGQKVLGVGDASGMFPILNADYNKAMLNKFNEHIKGKGINLIVENILPKVLASGQLAGNLSEYGAKLLDTSGRLQPGIAMCPPEGDAGTGMVATNSVEELTGNISAGTSLFAMIVLQKPLKNVYLEIDMVTTPSASPVAMVHCNTCTSDIDAWLKMFNEVLELFGNNVSKSELYKQLYTKALQGDKDCDSLVNFNYYSGEPITDVEEGRPLFVRKPNSKLSLANFMRTHLYSTLATLKIGMDILVENEGIHIKSLLGHGGFFKTELVGQKFMADALNIPVAVMQTAAEGGAWGIALLASYMVNKAENQSLEDYLNNNVFNSFKANTIEANPDDNKGFNEFLQNYKACLPIQKVAIKALK